MTTLEKIVAELRRQQDLSGWDGLGWLDLDNLRCSGIDGQVDLVALANAIDGVEL